MTNQVQLKKQKIFKQLIKIEQNIPLADKNWFKTGGNAKFYYEPTTPEEFRQALDFAHKKNLEIFVLGQGANILISDEGFDGLIIRPKLTNISIQNLDENFALITAGSGTLFHDLIVYCLNHNLLNLEEFSGIPGTVGGAVYINFHYYEFLLEHFIQSAEIINKTNGNISTVSPAWFNFSYDLSKLHEKEYFLLSATFKTKKATDPEIAFAKGRRQEIIRHRERRYPHLGTCGSFFRNFLQEEVQHTDKKLIYVAYYLDKIGIKGELCVNDAIVSHQHANMIVNKGKATSSDILQLARLMQQKVYDQFSIKPQPECQFLGFKENPLL